MPAHINEKPAQQPSELTQAEKRLARRLNKILTGLQEKCFEELPWVKNANFAVMTVRKYGREWDEQVEKMGLSGFKGFFVESMKERLLDIPGLPADLKSAFSYL